MKPSRPARIRSAPPAAVSVSLPNRARRTWERTIRVLPESLRLQNEMDHAAAPLSRRDGILGDTPNLGHCAAHRPGADCCLSPAAAAARLPALVGSDGCCFGAGVRWFALDPGQRRGGG